MVFFEMLTLARHSFTKILYRKLERTLINTLLLVTVFVTFAWRILNGVGYCFIWCIMTEDRPSVCPEWNETLRIQSSSCDQVLAMNSKQLFSAHFMMIGFLLSHTTVASDH